MSSENKDHGDASKKPPPSSGEGASVKTPDGPSKQKISGVSAMDMTKAIRDVADPIKQEYFKMIEELLKTEVKDRDERVRIFENRKFSPDAEKHFMEEIVEREKIHFDFMAIVFPETYEIEFGKPLLEHYPDYPPHDHTKDKLFYFLLAVQFDILKEVKTDEDKDVKQRTKPLVDHELDRHYSLEPHHPEYEDRIGKECQEVHIFEMAIDRLARNVQFNHGEIHWDQMVKFLPRFHLEDTKKKDEIYMNFVNKYKDQISRRSKELYYDKECVKE